MFNPYFCFPFYLPTWNTKPPTLYAIMNSIANFGKEDKTKIKDLAKASRSKIFNFTYPLSSKVKKEDFEKMILNKFMKRRIGFETVTDFRIHLDIKLNEIMPIYNKMFDALEGWDIFNDGDITVRTGTDDRNINNTINENNDTTHTENRTSNNDTTNSLTNTSTSSGNNTSDLRFSNTPQNELQNVKDGKYITEYNYNQDNSSTEDNSTSNGTSNSTNNDNINYTNNIDRNTTNTTKDNNKYNETITHSPSDKIAIYKQFQEDLKSIYTLIFKDLDCLFYQIIDE